MSTWKYELNFSTIFLNCVYKVTSSTSKQLEYPSFSLFPTQRPYTNCFKYIRNLCKENDSFIIPIWIEKVLLIEKKKSLRRMVLHDKREIRIIFFIFLKETTA
jgi:hypothetical protein